MRESRSGVAWDGGQYEWRLKAETEIIKWPEEISGGNWYVHDLEGGDGFTVYTYVKINEIRKH